MDGVPRDAQEHSVQEESGKKKNVNSEQHLYVIQNLKVLCRAEDWNKRNEQGVTVMTQALCYWHETKTRDPLFWIIKYNITLDMNLLQVRMSPNGSWGISSGSFLISKDVALSRVVLCLAHNGKVAWDVKWWPSNASESKCKLCMDYLSEEMGMDLW